MDELKEILKKLENRMSTYGSDLSELTQTVNKINELALSSIEDDIKKSFIDSLLSIPAFDEYDSVFSSFKETIYEDRLNNTRKVRGSLRSLEKNAFDIIKSSKIFDPTLNRSIMSYFKGVNSLQSVEGLTKKNKDKITIKYEYDSLLFDYNHYKELGAIDGLKEVQDVFGATKMVPFEMPSKELVDEKNRLDQQLSEFTRAKELIGENPEFKSVIKSSYPKTLNKLDEYIENYENKVRIVNESLGKTDYKEIKEAVENARINDKKETEEKDENKENILDSKKRELDDLQKQASPNRARIESLQNEIASLEKEEEEKTIEEKQEEMKDENLNEEKVTFEKSDDEDLIEDATFINLREEAIKKMKENDPELKNITSLKDYEAKVNEYMQAIRDERIKNRDIKDVEFDLYKQDRTLTDEVEDTEFDKNDDKIVEYENAARMYMEKENEVFEDSLNREENIKSLLDELDDSELDLSDYEEMLRELDENLEISLEEEIETRKLA